MKRIIIKGISDDYFEALGDLKRRGWEIEGPTEIEESTGEWSTTLRKEDIVDKKNNSIGALMVKRMIQSYEGGC